MLLKLQSDLTAAKAGKYIDSIKFRIYCSVIWGICDDYLRYKIGVVCGIMKMA